MNKKNILVTALLVLGVLLAFSFGWAAAQDAQPPPRAPQSPDAPEAYSSYIPIQGRLTDAGGNPLNGSYQITFRLYAQYTGGSELCRTTNYEVDVDNGLFNAYILGTGCHIDGRALYLGIQVEDDPEMTPRQFIDNVPIAWTLRPGAEISATLNSNAILHIENWGTSGRGLRAYAMDESGTNYGVVGASRSPNGYGGFFYNTGGGVGLLVKGDDNTDLILGGSDATTPGDDGILASDPQYASSDIIIRVNDTLRIDLDDDKSDEDADFEIYDKDDNLIFDVDESGDVTYGGDGIAAFPRPAYDSGWQTLGLGATRTLNHNLGGNADNYVVDLTCKSSGEGVNNWGVGGDVGDASEYYGAWWSDLDTTSVTIHRWTDDTDCPNVRIRIWMYP